MQPIIIDKALAPIARLPPVFGHALLALPALAAVVFVHRYSVPTPFDDDWLFVQTLMSVHEHDLRSMKGVIEALRTVAMLKIFDHHVVVPFLIYWPLAEIANLDSRPFIYITVAAYAVHLVVFRLSIVQSSIAAFPVALILFSRLHYAEFLWGFEFTLALSILFPLLGLLALDRIGASDRILPTVGMLLTGIGLILLGVLSSAGGFFGFPAALVLLALKRIDRPTRILSVGALAVAAAIVYLKMSPSGQMALGFQPILRVLTTLGATIWNSPHMFLSFSLDRYSVTGLVLATVMAMVVVRAAMVGLLPRIALPAALFSFSMLAVAAIALNRLMVANWHLQYAVPATCAVYAAAYLLWRADRSRLAALALAVVVVLCAPVAFSYIDRSDRNGYGFRLRIHDMQRDTARYLENPDRPRDYSPPWDISADKVLFLSARNHPLFHGDNQAKRASALARNETVDRPRIFLGERELEDVRALPLAEANVKHQRLVVALPDGPAARALVLQAGDRALVLRKIHPRLANVPACHSMSCFAGLILARTPWKGAEAARVLVVY
jgi:hypothetical protein